MLEISPLDTSTGLNTTIRLTDRNADDRVTLMGPGWLPAIVDDVEFSYSIWSEGSPSPISTSYGAVTILLDRVLRTHDLTRLKFDGAVAALYLGQGGDFANYERVFTGSMGPLVRDDDRMAKITLTGPESALVRDLLTTSYQGTGGLEGTTEMIGRLKPWSNGAVTNVEPILIDPIALIYQVDGGSIVNAIYENALSNGTPATTVASYAALKAATVAPGKWARAPGLFRLGSQPTGKITADAGTASTVNDTIIALLRAAGIADAFIGATLRAASPAYDLYVTDQTTILDAIRAAAMAGGQYLIPDALGVWHLAPFASTKAPGRLMADQSAEPTVMPDTIRALTAAAPAWRVKVGHTRVWSPHTSSEISPAIRDQAAQNDAIAKAAADATDKANAAQADATFARARVENQALDGVLDRTEKLQVVRDFAAYTAERAELIATGQGLSVTTEVSAYAAAYDALKTYLEGLTPAYTDTTADTVINAATYKARFLAYTTARQTLVNATAAHAADRAKWDLVTGPNKPTDNADKTSDNTAKDTNAVAGVPAATVTDAIKDTGGAVIRIRDIKSDIDTQITTANTNITNARKAATDAADAVTKEIQDRINAIVGVNQRIDSVAADGGYDDTFLRSEVSRVDRAYQAADLTFGQSILTLKSTYNNSKGLTPNSDFRAGSEGWTTPPPSTPLIYDFKSATSVAGLHQPLNSIPIAILEPNRGYRLHCIFDVIGAPCVVYVGLQMHNSADAHIGNVYADETLGQTFQVGSYSIDKLYKGATDNSPIPQYRGGQSFVPTVDYVRLIVLPNYNSIPGAQVRIRSLWLEDVGSVELANATISNVSTTASDAKQAVADLTTSVATRFKGTNDNVAGIDSRLTTLSNNYDATATKTTTLEATSRPGGNLVPNSAFTTLAEWTLTFNADNNATVMALNLADNNYMIGRVENQLGLFRGAGGNGLCAEVQSPPFAVRGGSTLQFYAITASHRCNAWVSLFFYDSTGAQIDYAGENMGARINLGGTNINDWDRTGRQAQPVPLTAIRARFVLRSYNVSSDGYAWFCRPFVTEVQPGANTWAAYAPGSDKPLISAANARISAVETVTTNGTFAAASRVDTLEATVNTGPDRNSVLRAAITNLQTVTTNGTFAAASVVNTLSSNYEGTKATVEQQAGTIARVDGRTAAYWSVGTNTGNGRAQLSVYSNSNGGGGVDIVGDVAIAGNLLVNGSISAQKIQPSAVQQVAFQTLAYTITVPRG